jgi:1-acyl-sn-glycerol-3-phosphate acyltransferase
MLRTIIWFIYFGISLILTLPSLIYAKYLGGSGRIKEREALANKTARWWARSLVKLSGARIKVTGEENIPSNSQVVFIGNHQGNFDIPIFLGYIKRPKGFIAKIEITKIPIVSTWMRYLNCVFMDRSDIRKSITAINEGIEILKKGHSLVIFPEGTRSRSMETGEFKQGSFKLATKAGMPIIPVTMKGSFKIFELNKGIIRPADVEIIISPPIETKELSIQETKELPDRIKNIILNNLKY